MTPTPATLSPAPPLRRWRLTACEDVNGSWLGRELDPAEGEYVLWEDVAELVARLAAVRAKVREAVNNVPIHTHADTGAVNRQRLAAALDRELAALDANAGNDGWVPVTETGPLPDFDVDSLVMDKNGRMNVACRREAIDRVDLWKSDGGHALVTHWRPLPPPPVAAPAGDAAPVAQPKEKDDAR